MTLGHNTETSQHQTYHIKITIVKITYNNKTHTLMVHRIHHESKYIMIPLLRNIVPSDRHRKHKKRSRVQTAHPSASEQ